MKSSVLVISLADAAVGGGEGRGALPEPLPLAVIMGSSLGLITGARGGGASGGGVQRRWSTWRWFQWGRGQ